MKKIKHSWFVELDLPHFHLNILNFHLKEIIRENSKTRIFKKKYNFYIQVQGFESICAEINKRLIHVFHKVKNLKFLNITRK